MANFRSLEPPTEVFTARALAALSKGDACKFGAGGIDQAGDGDQVDCFAQENIASGSYGTFYRGQIRMIGRAASGVNFSVGDKVYLDANQALDTGSTGNKAVGEVVGDDPESDGWVEFTFDHLAAFTHA